MRKMKRITGKGLALLLAIAMMAGVFFNTRFSAAFIEPELYEADAESVEEAAEDDGGTVPVIMKLFDGSAPQPAEETATENGVSGQPAENTVMTDGGDLESVVTQSDPIIRIEMPDDLSVVNTVTLDTPGTRTDTVPATSETGDPETPLDPTDPRNAPSTPPETDIDENSPYAPKITFGTGSGLFARWGSSALANEYYLTPDDTVTLTTANEPEGAKVYFTCLNTAIDAYKADPDFDFADESSGWTEYADHVTLAFSDHYARVGAVMTDISGKAIKGTFISTNFWELDCDRKIGVYGGIGTYNLRMTDYLNLSGATASNFTQAYYLKAAVNEEAVIPSETDYDFKLSDSEPAYLNDILDHLTGNVDLDYKGICVYYKDGEAVYTSPVYENAYQFELTPCVIFSNEYDDTDDLYYPCRLSARIIYGGNFDTVWYGIGQAGDTASTEGWTKADGSFEVSGEINAEDVALYAILTAGATGAGYAGGDGSFIIFEKPLIRVADTVISGGESSSITLESAGVPDEFASEIYYTLNGSDPAENGSLYTGPISTDRKSVV